MFNFARIHVFHLLALVYLLLSIYYAQERILNTDCTYQIFTSINTKDFFFQEGRYGMFPTQILLVVGILIKAPAIALIHLYSISFPLLYITVLLVNHLVFKSKEAALATVLSLVIGSGATFFHATTETHLLVALGCLFFGAISARGLFKSRRTLYAVWATIVAWSLFVHPNAVFTLFFVCGFSFLLKRMELREWVAVVLICGAYLLIKTYMAPVDSYDSKQYSRLAGFTEVIPRFFDLWPVQFIKLRLWDQYLGIQILLVVLLVAYRIKLVLLFTLLFITGFMMLTIFTFAPGDSNAMMEKSFMPAIFMIVLVYSNLHYQLENKLPNTLLIIALSVHSFYIIVENGIPYQERLNAITNILTTHGDEHPKLIAEFKDLDEETFRNSHWATSMDALLLSRCIGNEPRTLFVTESIEEYRTDLIETNTFIYLPWAKDAVSLENMDYFDLPEVPYYQLTSGEN
ncbi:MAG: hypothetical protein KA408_12660 [Flavobacteriales bacterium]|nr:hypothetical protein [Flavobacteriales bacterium]